MSGQTPDPKPGNYYVSAIDGPERALASGPYQNHAQALAMVNKARDVVCEHDGCAWFAAWGTVRMTDDYTKPGVLQKWGYDLNCEKLETVNA